MPHNFLILSILKAGEQVSTYELRSTYSLFLRIHSIPSFE